MKTIAAIALLSAVTQLGAQASTERDSAGIRIIQNSQRATAPVVFKLGTKTLDIGGPATDLDDEFNAKKLGTFGGIRLSDGTFAVTNAVRMQFYDAQGRKTGALGREGAGPSEFRSIGMAEFCRTRGDTLVLADYRNGRFAVVHQRQVVRTIAYTHFGGGFAGCFDDGTVLMQAGLPNFHTPTYNIRLNRLRLDGTLVKEFEDVVVQSPSAISLIHPTIRARGQRVYVGDLTAGGIRVFNADGRLTHIIRTADSAQRVTAEDAERALRGQRATMRDWWRPETFPLYSGFHLDPDGRLWVQDFTRFGDNPPERDYWTAFDTNGKLIGRLEIPRSIGTHRAQVLAFGVNEVQMMWGDEDGFYRLAFYPIIKN